MIPSPNLDDRTFDDIVQEAIRLIPQYCPEWTNHNPSDPGIALIELFAWMTEMTLYRLNRVPEKNYLAFLELMGVTLAPPQPARTVLQFAIHPKADRVVVPAGTRVATKPGQDGSSVTFETDHEITVTNNQLVKCLSQHHDTFSDNTALLGRKREGVPIWAGVRALERFLYVSDARLAAFNESSILTLRTTAPADAQTPLCRMLEWEYFDGERWRELQQPSIDTDADQIALIGPLVPPGVTTVAEHEGLWLRGKLAEVPASAAQTACDVVRMRLELTGEGEQAELAYCVLDSGTQFRLDLERHVQPFGKEPAQDFALYLLCERVLGHVDAEVRIDIEIADPSVVEAPQASKELVIAWEYWSGKRWKLLGKSGIGEFDEEDAGMDFRDETRCLTNSGPIAFRRPKDLRSLDFGGKEGPWIRARIERGDYGARGTYELENDRWMWKNPRPLRPPTLKSVALRFAEQEHAFDKVVAYNDFVYTDLTAQASEPLKPFVAFTPVSEESPTLYLGFRDPFSNERHLLWMDLADGEGNVRNLRAGAGSTARHLAQSNAEQLIAWEFWNGREWAALNARDQTWGFAQSGFLEFVGPKDHRANKRYGENLYWLRARLEFGGYDELPLLRDVVLNAATASNLTTYGDTALGSSNGTPNQGFRFVRGPVLPGEEIWVRERERPTGVDLDALKTAFGESAVQDVGQPDGGGPGEGVLVRWQQVDSLYESAGNARHYVKDIVNNEIRFGDGIHGLVPPKGDRNILCKRYQVGGGEEGNVPAESLTVLLQAVPYVEKVRNLHAGAGGCNLETVEQAKRRGPHSLKARGRAVTAEDFEWLALEASNSVARVCALPTPEREGEVTLVVVPKVAENHPDFLEKPIPSTELLRRVRHHLADRKLLSTVLNVRRPAFRELSVQVDIIVLQSAGSERVKREIQRRVRWFLHPLKGGRDGKGWPFGRPVYRVDLYHVIEDVPGVDFVDRVRLLDESSKLEVEQFKVAPGELVHCVRVDVVEKAHERIV